ncbi:LA_2272 family surface repeat-containing protein [Aquimarina sp. SS2-1]|uniref:LA_2272 family surface repeat-containing protein n=1 Tax=Aquimarina besae TaxID=3342247 RepID=UPI00366E8F1C
MKNKIVILIALFLTIITFGQERKTVFPIGLFNSPNKDIYGLSVGLAQKKVEPDWETTKSNGIRIEPFGRGFSIFFTPRIGLPKEESKFESYFNRKPTEIVNGINVSGGTLSFIDINGVSVSGGIQALRKMNGISISGFGNYSYKINGIQLAVSGSSTYQLRGVLLAYLGSYVLDGKGVQISGFNDFKRFKGLQIGVWNDVDAKSEKFEGIQIGILNNTKSLRGIQIGLWNKNERRSLPFINWQFSKKKVKSKTT